ncbi:hypothetical protein YK56LOC_71070 [Caballeronia sp. HLA56]
MFRFDNGSVNATNNVFAMFVDAGKRPPALLRHCSLAIHDLKWFMKRNIGSSAASSIEPRWQ